MTKYIVQNASTRPKVVYHTDKDCTHVKREDAVVEASDEFLEYHDARECLRCAGEYVRQTGDKTIYKAAVEAGRSD